jgi:two-component system, sensor histidine kinase and response regulator
MSTYSILVVDDEPDNFDVIQSLLPSQSYKLHYAINGEQAIASLEKFDPDVILLDVMMPGISGIEVCKQIKAMSRWQAVPIVMVTALSGKEDLARCLAAGADDFLSKPVNGLELAARVNSMLRIKKQHDRIKSLSKLQQNNIHSLANNLNEIRLDLAVGFPTEFNLPLNIISDNIEYIAQNIEYLNTSATLNLLESSNRSMLQLRNLSQKFWFYIQLLLDTPDLNCQYFYISQSIVEKNLVDLFPELRETSNLICEIEETQLAVSIEHFRWIYNELLEHTICNCRPNALIRIHGEVIDNLFHLSLSKSNYQEEGSSASILRMSSLLNSAANEYQELSIGLKIVKKLIELYDGIFLISSVDEDETTVYLTLPVVPISSSAIELPSSRSTIAI